MPVTSIGGKVALINTPVSSFEYHVFIEVPYNKMADKLKEFRKWCEQNLTCRWYVQNGISAEYGNYTRYLIASFDTLEDAFICRLSYET